MEVFKIVLRPGALKAWSLIPRRCAAKEPSSESGMRGIRGVSDTIPSLMFRTRDASLGRQVDVRLWHPRLPQPRCSGAQTNDHVGASKVGRGLWKTALHSAPSLLLSAAPTLQQRLRKANISTVSHPVSPRIRGRRHSPLQSLCHCAGSAPYGQRIYGEDIVAALPAWTAKHVFFASQAGALLMLWGFAARCLRARRQSFSQAEATADCSTTSSCPRRHPLRE